MKATPQQIDVLVKELESESQISYENFLNYCSLAQVLIKESKLRSYFKSCDQNGSGVIKLSDLKEILARPDVELPADGLQRIFREVVKMELENVDPAMMVDYTKFLASLRKEFKLE